MKHLLGVRPSVHRLHKSLGSLWGSCWPCRWRRPAGGHSGASAAVEAPHQYGVRSAAASAAAQRGRGRHPGNDGLPGPSLQHAEEGGQLQSGRQVLSHIQPSLSTGIFAFLRESVVNPRCKKFVQVC